MCFFVRFEGQEASLSDGDHERERALRTANAASDTVVNGLASINAGENFLNAVMI